MEVIRYDIFGRLTTNGTVYKLLGDEILAIKFKEDSGVTIPLEEKTLQIKIDYPVFRFTVTGNTNLIITEDNKGTIRVYGKNPDGKYVYLDQTNELPGLNGIATMTGFKTINGDIYTYIAGRDFIKLNRRPEVIITDDLCNVTKALEAS